MKKLILALLIALGVAPVSAEVENKKAVADAVDSTIVDLGNAKLLNKQTTSTASAWIKAHPVKTAAIAAGVLAIVGGGVAAYVYRNKIKTYSDDGYAKLFAEPLTDQTGKVTTQGGLGFRALTNVKAHPYITGGATVGTVIVIAVIVDLARGDKSLLKKLFSKNKAVAEVKPVAPAAA